MFDDDTLERLAGEHPLGFYVCDLDHFDRNYESFLGAFRRHYPKTRIAYSYKTNYLPALCRRVDRLGGYAEVVSGLEYALARRLDVPGEKIVFNGPVKTRDDYALAARNGSIVNCEGEREIEILEALVRDEPGLRHRLGIRCAVRFPSEAPSRFGLDIDDPGFLERVGRLRRLPGVALEGLHCHMIPPGRRPESYAEVARRLLDVARKVWGESGPRFVDLGGGYYSNMSPEMRAQFDTEIPTFDGYGEAIAGVFAEAFGGRGGPELILEPGLALVADAFHFVCRVLDTKRAGERHFALAGGSVYNVRPTKSPRNLPLRHVPAGGARPVGPPVDVVGYTCMEDDVLHRGYEHALAVDDLLVFDNVGAYTLVLKPPFIQGNVPVISHRADAREPTVLKRAETLDDLMASYELETEG